MTTDILFPQRYQQSETLYQHEQAQTSRIVSRFAQAATTCTDTSALSKALFSTVHDLVYSEQLVLYQYQQSTSLLSPVAYWSKFIEVVNMSLSPETEEDPSYSHKKTSLMPGEADFPTDLLVSTDLNNPLSLVASTALHHHTLLRHFIPSAQQESIAELTIPLKTHHHLSGVLLLRRSLPFSWKDARMLRDVSALAAMSWYLITCKELLGEHEKKRIEDQQRQTQFLSLLTHELRSPLNSMHGYLDLALMGAGGELNEQQHEFIQRARIASQHLYTMLENLLCIARVDAERLRLHRTIVHLPALIDGAIEELELVAADYEITLQTDIDPHLPDLYADAARMQLLLRNLLKNAIQFTPKGGTVQIIATIEKIPSATSTSASTPDEDITAFVCLQVRDTGIGIAPEFQQHIFERFYRVLDKDADRGGGQGLGLSIVKLLVELHGGTITVTSKPGQGSTFTCLIPGLLT